MDRKVPVEPAGEDGNADAAQEAQLALLAVLGDEELHIDPVEYDREAQDAPAGAAAAGPAPAATPHSIVVAAAVGARSNNAFKRFFSLKPGKGRKGGDAKQSDAVAPSTAAAASSPTKAPVAAATQQRAQTEEDLNISSPRPTHHQHGSVSAWLSEHHHHHPPPPQQQQQQQPAAAPPSEGGYEDAVSVSGRLCAPSRQGIGYDRMGTFNSSIASGSVAGAMQARHGGGGGFLGVGGPRKGKGKQIELDALRIEVGMLQERCSAAENGLSSAGHDVGALRADRDALQQQVGMEQGGGMAWRTQPWGQ
jgi:hypothetical protein